MNEKVYGHTGSGKPINDEMIEQFVEEAEQGYAEGQLKELRRGRGRPPLGDAAKVVGSLRLDPGLRKEAELRARSEGVSVSELLRHALRDYLQVSDESHNHRWLRFNDLQIRNQNVGDETHSTKRGKNIDRRLASEIEQGFTSAMNDYAEWLNQMSGTFREFGADLKRVMDVDLGAGRETAAKILEKVQANSTIQISRVKAFVDEVEVVLSHWDEIIRSKSGRR